MNHLMAKRCKSHSCFQILAGLRDEQGISVNPEWRLDVLSLMAVFDSKSLLETLSIKLGLKPEENSMARTVLLLYLLGGEYSTFRRALVLLLHPDGRFPHNLHQVSQLASQLITQYTS